MADNKKRLKEIDALLKNINTTAEEKAKLTKEENYLLKETISLQVKSLDLSSSLVDSVKEVLGYSTKRTTSDSNLLKVNKEINSSILNQKSGVRGIADINKSIAKNQKTILKGKNAEASLEKLIGAEKLSNVSVVAETASLLNQIQTELDNELKLLEEGKLENLDNIRYLQEGLKFHDAILDSQMRGLGAEEQQLLFTKLNVKELEKQNAKREIELGLAKKIEGKLGVAGKLNKLLGAIPGIGGSATKALEEVTKELNRAANNMEKLPSKAKIAAIQFKALGKNIVKDLLDPTTLAVGALTMFFKVLVRADKAAGELAKNMGISYKEAIKLSGEAREIAKGFEGVAGKDVLDAQSELNKHFGTAAKFSKEISGQFALIQKRTGLSDKAMGTYAKLAMKSGKSIKTTLKDVNDTVLKQNQQNKLTFSVKEVQEEIVKSSSAIKLQTKGSVVALSNAVIEAKKLGSNLAQVEQISSSLLDFESSIQAELQAELLLGKDINLEKARQFAMQGKTGEVAKEVMKQEAVLNAFKTDNVVAQEAAAKAIGLSRNELADMILKQGELAILQKAYGTDVKSVSDAQDEYNKKIAEGQTHEQASKDIADESLKKQLESVSIAQQFEETMARITDIFMSMAEPILLLVQSMIDLVGGAENFANILVGIAATYLIIKGAMMASKALQAGQLAYEGAKAAILGTQAVAATTTNAMATFGIGTVIAIAAVAAGLASLATYGFMADGVIGPGGEMVVSGPKGSIQLDKDDSIIAGTDLGGKGKGGSSNNNINIQPIVAAINAQNVILNQIAAKSPVIEMGGNEVGQGINTAEREIQ